MKISASNIAWETKDMDKHLSILLNNGADGLELSPSMIWDEPTHASVNEIIKFKKNVDSYGLEIPSMHSLTFSRNDLSFFSNINKRRELINYIQKLIEFAYKLNIKYLVYGSGSSRNIGNKNKEESLKILANSFREIADYAESFNIPILIEYLSKNYSDCINNAPEAYELMQEVDHPMFKMHSDLRSSFEINEDLKFVWTNFKDYIMHCHVGNPGLKPPSEECNQHIIAAKYMKKAGYNRYISIEMLREKGNTEKNLISAIDFIKEVYC